MGRRVLFFTFHHPLARSKMNSVTRSSACSRNARRKALRQHTAAASSWLEHRVRFVGNPEDFVNAITAIDQGVVKEFLATPGAEHLKELAFNEQVGMQSRNLIGAFAWTGGRMDTHMLNERRGALVTVARRSDIVFAAPVVEVARPDPEQLLSRVLKSFYTKAESFLCELLTSALESVEQAARVKEVASKELNIQVIADKRDRMNAGYSIAIEDNGIGMVLNELAGVAAAVRGFRAKGGLARLSDEPCGRQIVYSLTLASWLSRRIVVISKCRDGTDAQCIWEADGREVGVAREDVDAKYGNVKCEVWHESVLLPP